MIIIADSGSTKTDWVMSTRDGRIIERIKTEGINPVHQRPDAIRDILVPVCRGMDNHVVEVHFYGSGLRPEYRHEITDLLSEAFPAKGSTIEAESDLLGAARALCGHNEGLACILGTGSNSCLFDGRSITANTPALGYILGDEGSGAYIGRKFLRAIYKGHLPESVRRDFESAFSITLPEVIDRVYRQPLANRWLASLTTFIGEHLNDCQELDTLVVDAFCDFLRFNIVPYGRHDLLLNATGSIAYHFRTQLLRACHREGFSLGRVLQAPMEGLVEYHCQG